MAAHIGIVACSAEGAALCYRTIAAEGAGLMGRHAHPEVTMHTHPLSLYMSRIEAGDWDGVAELMVSSVRIVVGAGAQLIVCPDNTIHQAYERAAPRAGVPWPHIAEVVAEEARRRGFRTLGILGTRYLMEGPVYPSRLAGRSIGHVLPEPADRARINAIIFDELVAGRFTDASRAAFAQIIERLKERGCDAVVLGCTEIPLLIDDSASPLPTLDSTRLLARAALDRALDPLWRSAH
jgi:aspartate racemase